jgi:hypothetical protein
LAVQLLVERVRRRPIKPNHLKSYNRTPASLLRARFPFGHGTFTRLLPISFPFAGRILKIPTAEPVKVTGTIIKTTTEEGAAVNYQPFKTPTWCVR